MGYEILKLVAQSSSAAYAPIKDFFLYMKNKANYVNQLNDNLINLTTDMTNVNSRMVEIERKLQASAFRESTGEYRMLQRQIEDFWKKYNEFVEKYGNYCANPPQALQELDVSTASRIIDMLQENKPTVLTRKFFMLAKLSKDVKMLRDYISQVIAEVKQENLIREKEPEAVQVKHEDIDLPSVDEYVEEILGYLGETENRSIGIVGLIGVGKTNVMKRLNNRLNGNMRSKFDVVIWINYPKELDTKESIIKMMQDLIMERLKSDKGNSIEQNAYIISTELRRKKCVVLIDQVSSMFDLYEVGFHKDHKSSKVVVASSNKKVIRQMTDHQVEIKRLSNDDAHNLFQQVCGVVHDPRIKAIADKIIESCGGLPLVIKLVAQYLKGKKDENEWSGVKRILQSETKMAKLLGLGGVGNAYKLVYDGLEESYLKKCLLFGALFPSNHEIYKDYFVECWIAEGFLHTSDTDFQKLRSGRERGASILRELTDKYLLERCSDSKYVKMPGYFRKVALEQQYPDEENCVIWAQEENKLLNKEIWRTVTRMSLMCRQPELPECPESPNISTLLLQWYPELAALGDSFFVNMKNLRVLNLNHAKIESLPTSISHLVNLISLCLIGCTRLANLPPGVGLKLEKIEFLDIQGTSIPSLPQEIGDMVRLRCLRVSFGPKGCGSKSKGKGAEVMIRPNIISRLKELEELIIETGCCNAIWNDIADSIAHEITSLEKLTSLGFHFPNVCSLKKFVTTSKSWKSYPFNSFKISIGCCETQHPYDSEITRIVAERHLRFSTNEEILSVKEVLEQASAFELVGHHTVESLSEFDLKNVRSLKVCVIKHCNNLRSIVDADKTNDGGVLQCLEKLHLFDLPLLLSIWKGLVFSTSLSNLKVLTICGCDKLTCVLNHELAETLLSLEHLKVENCCKLLEIVDVQGHANNSGILQTVNTIELVKLPDLKSICRSVSMTWNSLRKIEIISCKKLRNLPLNAEKLETIKCEARWWDTLQLSEEENQHFRDRCHFIDMEEGSSSNRRSVNTRVSDNGGNGHDEATSNNDSLNAYIVNGVENFEDVILHKPKLVSSRHKILKLLKIFRSPGM